MIIIQYFYKNITCNISYTKTNMFCYALFGFVKCISNLATRQLIQKQNEKDFPFENYNLLIAKSISLHLIKYENYEKITFNNRASCRYHY